MPLSTITHSEWNFIVGIMKYKLGNTSFETRFNGSHINLRQMAGFNLAMVQLLGT